MTDPIRVLMISGEYPPMEGGVADFTSIVDQMLVDRGAEVHVLTSARGGEQCGRTWTGRRSRRHGRLGIQAALSPTARARGASAA